MYTCALLPWEDGGMMRSRALGYRAPKGPAPPNRVRVLGSWPSQLLKGPRRKHPSHTCMHKLPLGAMEPSLVHHQGRIPGFFQETLILNRSKFQRENPSPVWQRHLGPVRFGESPYSPLPGHCHSESQLKEMTTPCLFLKRASVLGFLCQLEYIGPSSPNES